MASNKVRQRKGTKTSTNSKKDTSATTPTSTTPTAPIPIEAPKTRRNNPPTWLRLFLFLILPSVMGALGLITSYLQHLLSIDPDDASNNNMTNPVNFDRDFIYPFLMTLAFVSVLWFQTKGFSTTEVKPLVAWPKVKRKRRVIRRTVIVDENGNEIPEEEDGDDDDDDNNNNEDEEEEEETKMDSNRRRGSRKED